MTSNRTLNLQHRIFVVNERPLCLWDEDIRAKNLSFLDSLDPSYFEYMRDVHLQVINEVDASNEKKIQYAALALRSIYSQALETLFALIFATIQAPYCVPAWMAAYNNRELSSLVSKVQNEEPVLSLLNIQISSWSSISEFLFSSLDQVDLENKKRVSLLKEGFARTWAVFAQDFLHESHSQEYNSIKHGLRICPGGFEVKISGVAE